MRLLLDTNAFLWLIAGDERITPRVAQLYLQRSNALFVSAASLWEIVIKLSLGKLELADDWLQSITRELAANGIQWLPIELHHCAALQHLPFHHRDPFDRMLVSQAIAEKLTLVSRDSRFADYDVELIW